MQSNFGVWLVCALLVTAVPEPGTTALMALGLGAVGFASRRRRQGLR